MNEKEIDLLYQNTCKIIQELLEYSCRFFTADELGWLLENKKMTFDNYYGTPVYKQVLSVHTQAEKLLTSVQKRSINILI